MTAGRRQRGITAIGALILACAFGVIGLAALKITPLYLQHLRLSTMMDDVREELGGNAPTPAGIRNTLAKHLSIEGMNLEPSEIKIAQSRQGYDLHIRHESRVPFIADIWFLLIFDKDVEIPR